MKKFLKAFLLLFIPILSACDLQPKITNLPDSISEFISSRYPALLADPETQPDIYNSAASDYGVYASPALYGTDSSNQNDYVLYSNVSDYTMPPQEQVKVAKTSENKIISAPTPDAAGDYLVVPMYGGIIQKDVNVKAAPTTTRVAVREVTVGPGDTLYSLSRKYEIPVNDLAVMNNLDAPFALAVGQKIKVPDIVSAKPQITPVKTEDVKTSTVKQTPAANVKTASDKAQVKEKTSSDVAKPKKISSDPSKKLPAISARSSSKFSWPVKGKVISAYGAKANGLFNDGINIGASRGTTVGAAENGVVAYAGNEVKGMGNLVIVQHADGWMTVYAHMDSMSVKRGTKVSVGQKIGTVGTTGKVDEPQLHFEVRKGTKAYNPSQYLKK